MMNLDQDKTTPNTEESKRTERPLRSFLQRDGGFDPILVELSDVLPAEVFAQVDLT